MCNQEKINKYNENKNKIRELSLEMNRVTAPLHEYNRKKRQTEKIEQDISEITCRITGFSILLSLIPLLSTRIVGFTLLGLIAASKSVVFLYKLRDKKLEKETSPNRIKYNELFKQQYDLIAQQKVLEKEIGNIDNLNLVAKLTRSHSTVQNTTQTTEKPKENLYRDIAYPKKDNTELLEINFNDTLDIESSLTDEDIYKTVQF